jgi:hypothetical protein
MYAVCLTINSTWTDKDRLTISQDEKKGKKELLSIGELNPGLQRTVFIIEDDKLAY